MATAHIPERMSRVDAFVALYEHAAGALYKPEARSPGSAWNAVQMFHQYCDKRGYCDRVRGVHMKMDFSKNSLDVKAYDDKYGMGEAQKAMDVYQKNRTPLDPRMDYNLMGNPCHYYTSYWKQRTPAYERRDLELFDRCEGNVALEKRTQDRIINVKTNLLFEHCSMSYAVRSPRGAYMGQKQQSCQEGLFFLKRLFSNISDEHSQIENLTVCRQNPSLPFLETCEEQRGRISLATAVEILAEK
jgi:hypothetical protein